MADVTARTSADLLDIARRVNPPEYSRRLEAATDGGWEIHEAQAAVMAALSERIAAGRDDLYILTADGAVRATGTVTLTRTSSAAGAITVKQGTQVLTEDGRAFLTRDDVSFGGADLGPHDVDVVAEADGYSYNVPAESIIEVGQLGPGSDEDNTLVVSNAAAIRSGHPPALDALGWNRGLPRRSGESDEDYRVRIRTLLDTVCPGAVDRLLERYAARYTAAAPAADWIWAEHWENEVFLGDDAFLDDNTDGSLLDAATYRGAFFVLVPDVGEVNDGDNYLDDDAFIDDETYLDEWDKAKAAIASGLLATLDRIKGGGIAIIVVQDGAPASAPAIQDNYSDDVEA